MNTSSIMGLAIVVSASSGCGGASATGTPPPGRAQDARSASTSSATDAGTPSKTAPPAPGPVLLLDGKPAPLGWHPNPAYDIAMRDLEPQGRKLPPGSALGIVEVFDADMKDKPSAVLAFHTVGEVREFDRRDLYSAYSSVDGGGSFMLIGKDWKQGTYPCGPDSEYTFSHRLNIGNAVDDFWTDRPESHCTVSIAKVPASADVVIRITARAIDDVHERIETIPRAAFYIRPPVRVPSPAETAKGAPPSSKPKKPSRVPLPR